MVKGGRSGGGVGWAAAFALVAAMGGCGGGGSGAGGGQGSTGGSGSSGSSGGNLSQRPAPAMPLYDDSVVHQVSLTMSADDWQSIIDDSRGDEWRHASVTYDGVVVDDVGVRPSGESSRIPGNQKQSFRIKFDAFSGGKFASYGDVNVKGEFDDGSMMRERLAFFVFGAFMPAVPKTAHTILMVNGNSRGLYTLREDWDETSISEHFTQPYGPLYRVRGALFPANPYAYINDDPNSYMPLPWERHIKMTARGDEVVPALLKALTDESMFESVVDVDDLIGYLVAAELVMTTDGLIGTTGASDHFQYFDPQSGKFVVLPWDPDNTFGSQGEMPTKSIYSKLERNSLTNVVISRSDLQARYIQSLKDGMAKLPVEMVQAKADAIYAQIKDAAHADTVKMFSNDSFDWGVMDIKQFTAGRYANLQMQLGN